jgi:putative ABC transport system ATP-binding protein
LTRTAGDTEDRRMSSRLPLRVRGLRKVYEADTAPVRALRGVDLDLDEGEFVSVTGPSGCGKSTLLNLIAGLDVPTSGEIVVAGEPLHGKSEDALARLRRRHIGVVFQFFNLLDDLTALENVALAAVARGGGRRQAEARARDLLDLLGLADRAHTPPRLFSGGERQRLAIARALANSPTLLLADEPTGSLDSDGGAEIVELLQRLNQSGQTILLVTHDQAVSSAASRIVEMRDGRLTSARGTDPQPSPSPMQVP